MISKKGIPVLSFHSVTNDSSWLPWPFICMKVEYFIGIISLLHKKGYKTVSIDDVINHMNGSKVLNGNYISITFDDGYLDNWVFVFPILKKFGYFGTLFMTTDFIDFSEKIRPQMNFSRINNEKLNYRGYLSSAELIEMEKQKVFSIECHCASHTWLFHNDKIIDFAKPKDPSLAWMYWNFFSTKKAFWFEDFKHHSKKLWGYPIYGFKRDQLVKKAFFPDIRIQKELNRFVVNQGGEKFFKKKNYKNELIKQFETLKTHYPGTWETKERTNKRLESEFNGSKKILEKILNKKIKYLCWPGDRFTKDLYRTVLNKFGYKAVTAGMKRNTTGDNPKLLSRMYIKHKYLPFNCQFLNSYLFYCELKVFEGNNYYYIISFLFNQINKIFKKLL